MRFGITVSSYYPAKDGVQFVTQALAEGLVKDGHEVYVITSNYLGCSDNEIHNGVIIRRVDIRNKAMLFFGNKEEYQGLVEELSKKVDIMIFAGVQRTSTAWVLPLLKDLHVRKYLYVHGIHEYKWIANDFSSVKNFMIKALRNIRWFIFYKYNKRNFKYLDGTFQLHKKDCGYQYFEKVLKGKNYVLENFVEDLFFEDEFLNYIKKNQFIYVANYCDHKNQMLLLKAIYMTHSDANLIFIGSKKNSYYQKLINLKKQLDKQYGERNVEFLVGLSRREIASLLAQSKAFVMTSKIEKFPISILEGMAVGTPFISTNVGIVSELPGGVIVDYRPDAIAKQMDSYLNDTNKYQMLQDQAKKYAEQSASFKQYMSKFYSAIELEHNKK